MRSAFSLAMSLLVIKVFTPEIYSGFLELLVKFLQIATNGISAEGININF